MYEDIRTSQNYFIRNFLLKSSTGDVSRFLLWLSDQPDKYKTMLDGWAQCGIPFMSPNSLNYLEFIWWNPCVPNHTIIYCQYSFDHIFLSLLKSNSSREWSLSIFIWIISSFNFITWKTPSPLRTMMKSRDPTRRRQQ